MFKIRDLMINAIPDFAGAQLTDGPIICYWPSSDCCGPVWSYPGGGNIGTSRWLTFDRTQTVTPGCLTRTVDTGCGVNYSTCADGSVYTLRDRLTRVVNPAELRVLKAELQQTIAIAEQREGELEEQLAPQTIQEVEQLETQLTEALEELKARRAELEKRAK